MSIDCRSAGTYFWIPAIVFTAHLQRCIQATPTSKQIIDRKSKLFAHFRSRFNCRARTWLNGLISKAATAMPRGIIQKPSTGSTPKIPPQTSNRPSTNRNPGATFCLTHGSVRLTRHLIHFAKCHWLILDSVYPEITTANITPRTSHV